MHNYPIFYSIISDLPQLHIIGSKEIFTFSTKAFGNLILQQGLRLLSIFTIPKLPFREKKRSYKSNNCAFIFFDIFTHSV